MIAGLLCLAGLFVAVTAVVIVVNAHIDPHDWDDQ